MLLREGSACEPLRYYTPSSSTYPTPSTVLTLAISRVLATVRRSASGAADAVPLLWYARLTEVETTEAGVNPVHSGCLRSAVRAYI